MINIADPTMWCQLSTFFRVGKILCRLIFKILLTVNFWVLRVYRCVTPCCEEPAEGRATSSMVHDNSTFENFTNYDHWVNYESGSIQHESFLVMLDSRNNQKRDFLSIASRGGLVSCLRHIELVQQSLTQFVNGNTKHGMAPFLSSN